MKDYELLPLVEQVNAPVNLLEEQELTEKTLERFEKTQAQWGDFKRKMANWNYTVRDGDGSHIFAYHKTFPIAGINVDISVEDAALYNHFDDSVGIGQVGFYKLDPDDHYSCEQLRNDQVPKRLMSQVIAQLEELIED